MMRGQYEYYDYEDYDSGDEIDRAMDTKAEQDMLADEEAE